MKPISRQARIHGASTLAAIVMLSTGSAFAASINASTAIPSVSALSATKTVVTVKHVFTIGYPSNEQTSCGARLEFSDDPAAGKNVTLTQSTTAKDVVVDRQYKKPGTYTVSLRGVAWGGYNKCEGEKTSSTEIKGPPIAFTNGVSEILESTVLTKLTLKKAEFAPGLIQLFALVELSQSQKKCAFDLSVTTLNGGADGINSMIGQWPIGANWLTKSLDIQSGSFTINTPGKFRATATARNFEGGTCHGTAHADFEVKRQKMMVGAEIGSITGMFMKATTSKVRDTVRQDEEFIVTVQGSVQNLTNPEKQCGWSLFVVDSGGNSKFVLTGDTFFKYRTIPAGTLAGYTPGKYVLQVRASAKGDDIGKAACKGEATNPFTLLKAVAVIKDVQLKSFGQHFDANSGHGPSSPGGEQLTGNSFCTNCHSIFSPAHDIGALRITPVFAAGQECSYEIIQKFDGKTTSHPLAYTPGNAMAGSTTMLPPALNVYPNDSTLVTVTLVGAPHPLLATYTPCDGTITKSIMVHDDATLPAISK